MKNHDLSTQIDLVSIEWRDLWGRITRRAVLRASECLELEVSLRDRSQIPVTSQLTHASSAIAIFFQIIRY